MPDHIERRALSISEDQLIIIAKKIAESIDEKASKDLAEKAAVIAVGLIKANLYQEAGKTLLSKILQLLGVILLGAMYWLNKNGFIQIN